MKKLNTTVRIFVLMLAVIMLINPVTVGSADEVEPKASDYINTCSATASALGAGRVRFSFTIRGFSPCDLGVKTIEVYESINNSDWTKVHTYTSSDYSYLMGEDVSYHSDYVTYYGIAGRYYKAYFRFWGGNGIFGESNYVWTSVVKG